MILELYTAGRGNRKKGDESSEMEQNAFALGCLSLQRESWIPLLRSGFVLAEIGG